MSEYDRIADRARAEDIRDIAIDLRGACIDMLFAHSIISEYESCHCIACERTRAAVARARGSL